MYNSDLMVFIIGKQYPKYITCNKKQNYYLEKPLEYNWNFIEYKYTRY